MSHCSSYEIKLKYSVYFALHVRSKIQVYSIYMSISMYRDKREFSESSIAEKCRNKEWKIFFYREHFLPYPCRIKLFVSWLFYYLFYYMLPLSGPSQQRFVIIPCKSCQQAFEINPEWPHVSIKYYHNEWSRVYNS